MDRTAFVARERELAQLRNSLEHTLAGQGQICFIAGEAGAGKTALITEFARRAQEADADLVVATGNCNAQTGIGDPYLPFREIIGQLTGDVEGQPTRGGISVENARRLQAIVRWTCEALAELGPDLIDILVPGSKLLGKAGAFVLDQVGWPDKLKQLIDGKAGRPLGGALEQSRIFEQTTNVFKALAAKKPLLLVLDDLQWADSASVALLFHLGRRLERSRILVLGAYRGEEVQLGRGGERHPLEKVLAEFKRYYGDVWVDLDRAEQEEARAFVDALVDLEPNRLGPSFRRLLVQHTGGHPLFAVELLRNLQERGDLARDWEGRWVEGASLDWDALPPRVEGVIEERIGRLHAELKDTLTVASVEGEQFTAEVVARVRKAEERALVGKLSNELDRQHHLVVAQGIRRLGRQALSSYGFRHNLFQKYLYEELDAAQRSYLHEDVGTVLEGLYGEQAGEIAVQLARHFEEAGLAEKAIGYLRLAAEQAMWAWAHTEAIGHLSRALALVGALPATPERDQLELPLQMDLATSTCMVLGYWRPDVQAALDRACELCRRAECMPQLIPVLRALYIHYHSRGEHRVAHELAGQLVSLAQQSGDPAAQLMAYSALGQELVQLGGFVAGREALERALAYYDPEQYRGRVHLSIDEPGAAALAYLGVALVFLGYPDQALVRFRTALTIDETLAHPAQLVGVLYGISLLHVIRREGREAQALAEKGIAHCDEKNIPLWRDVLRINRAHALALQGCSRDGLAEGMRALAAYRALPTRLFLPFLLTQVAEMHLLAGQVEAGLAVVAEGFASVDDTGEHKVDAELHRLRAELLARQGGAAEADLQRALEVARKQQARWWELRATMSLCRLWREQGKREQARQALAGIYGWFTEGFDTPDLLAAKALLDELSQ